jgi:RNA polymerase sigma-70 factor (ECF subfamily)
MAADQSFTDLMDRLNAGDDSAAAEIFHRFAHRLIGLARTRLDRLLQSKVDPEDVMQSVYRSFFRRHLESHYDLDGWDGLWGMLTVITLRKCGHRGEYFRAARRDVRRETTTTNTVDQPELEFACLARDPTPSHAARLAETVEQVMRSLEGRERDIFALSLQGCTAVEISEQVGRTERTVQRVLKRVREQLLEMKAEAA